jgi:uncharacterized membrane protein
MDPKVGPDQGTDRTLPARGIASRAALGGHPLHPMVIPLPIGMLVAALVTDVAFWVTGDAFWAQVSWWALWAGLATGMVAAVLGLVDFLAIGRVRELLAGKLHLIANVVALVVAAANLALRGAGGIEAAVLPWGLLLTAITNAAIAIGGWFGGELSYRHGIGVTGP